MNLYRCSQYENDKPGSVGSFIVAAEKAVQAQRILPFGLVEDEREEKWVSPGYVNVMLIGTAAPHILDGATLCITMN